MYSNDGLLGHYTGVG